MTMVYCSWVNADVDREKNLIAMCEENIKDGRCDHCERSEQLNYGVDPQKLIKNLKSD